MAKKLPTPAQLITARHWRPLRLAAEDLLADGGIDAPGIRAVDRWLDHVERQKWVEVTANHCLSFFSGSIAPNPIAKLARALHALDPTHPHLPVISQALEQRSRTYRPAKPTRARSRTPSVSVEVHELPAVWQAAIADMRNGAERGCRAPSPEIIRTIEMKLRQLAFSARQEGLAADLTLPALTAYTRTMIDRDLAASTIASTLGKLQTFGHYVGAGEDVLEAIRGERLFQESLARKAGKNKDRFLAQSGLSIEDVARAALETYEGAWVETNPRRRHMDFMRAALFAFTLCRSLRPLDLRSMIVGQHLRRDADGWSLYTRTSKNSYRLLGQMWDVCTPYLDGAILLGADPAGLWRAYDRAQGRALFADRDCTPLCDNWATEQFKETFGTGVGIMRTLWHDHCATVGTERALQTALAICGQYAPRTTAHYRTSMSARNLMSQGQDLVASASEAVQMGGPSNRDRREKNSAAP